MFSKIAVHSPLAAGFFEALALAGEFFKSRTLPTAPKSRPVSAIVIGFEPRLTA
jgi:hypothetical protein